ncbi:MAG: phosphomannomutase/phosphoglucomutase [Alphaproteobacteria bacterium]|nr:phosphomannomutase/phosphoglucomutase [Alphaproteobacteria bacterium]
MIDQTKFLSIFREYDIRGIVGQDLNAEFAFQLGQGYGSWIQEAATYTGGSIVIGYDGRLSSPMLQDFLAKGIASTGLGVIIIGLGPTPMLYYAVHNLQAAGGIMITGSHNPPDYNGFKIMQDKKALYGADIKQIGERMLKGDFKEGDGKISHLSVVNGYILELEDAFQPHNQKKLKIVWDPGNGATGEIVKELLENLPGDHILINEKIDGTFPAHHPDPAVLKNLQQVIDLVLSEKADIGFAFDGDGDRVGIIDDEGEVLWGDQILLLLSRYLLEEEPGATIIADVKASQSLFDDIKAHGGNPLMWKTGHSLVKAKMKETGALLGGEMSGHIFFAHRYYGFDDGVYAAVRFMEMLADSGQKLSDLRKSLPKVINTPELRFDCADEIKFEVITKVQKSLKDQSIKFNDVDGLRVSNKDGWFLLRASNTQPALVARVESSNDEGLQRLMAMLQKELKGQGLELPTL